MKKFILTAILFIITSSFAGAQELRMGFRNNADMAKQREKIREMNPEQRKELLKEMKSNIMTEGLDISEDKKQQFKEIYAQYQDEQNKIKGKFQTDFDPDKLTDAEAEQKLEESFQVGEELLKNRRTYARKMQEFMRPQQVIKMFRTEGMMREKTLERRSEIRGFQGLVPQMKEGSSRTSSTPGFRNGLRK